jgi:hypothetical protein
MIGLLPRTARVGPPWPTGTIVISSPGTTEQDRLRENVAAADLVEDAQQLRDRLLVDLARNSAGLSARWALRTSARNS